MWRLHEAKGTTYSTTLLLAYCTAPILTPKFYTKYVHIFLKMFIFDVLGHNFIYNMLNLFLPKGYEKS
jgi:hypothetical protein